MFILTGREALYFGLGIIKLSKNKEWKMFNLVKACKDCPFKKGKSYLSEKGLMERINDVKHHDKSFICHKSIDYSASNPVTEIEDDINEEIDFLKEQGCDKTELLVKRIELVEEYGLIQVKQKYEETLKNEMYCAGMLILAKKAGFIMNNRALRYALSENLLDLDQFVDEDEIYDSVEEAAQAHRIG